MQIKNISFTSTVVSETDSDKTYEVKFGSNRFLSDNRPNEREWSCSCPSWQFTGKYDGTYCKHIKSVTKSIGLILGIDCLEFTSEKKPVTEVNTPAVYQNSDPFASSRMYTNKQKDTNKETSKVRKKPPLPPR